MLAATAFEWIRALAALVLGATAIVVAALVAARTANERQQRQLDAEHERHEALLASELDRLDRQLAHD